MLQAEKWKLAELVFDFAINIPEKYRSKGEVYYYFIINKAIALKEQGKQIENLISKVDWSAFHPKFNLAVSVLSDDFKKAEKLMITESVKEALTEESFRTFPLFRKFRQSEEFKRAYKVNSGKRI